MKRFCKKCHTEKEINSFVKSKESHLGYRHICKQCHNKKFNLNIGTGKNPNGWFKKGHGFIGGGSPKGVHNSIKTEFKKGVAPHNKGKKTSKELREKLSKSAKGRVIPKEQRINMSISQKKRVAEGRHNNYFGVSNKNRLIRTGVETRLWREAVFARDNWTCQKYGTKGGMLRCHHIQNFSQYPELRFAIDNGITLSDKAHREFHKKYGFKNNTREQLVGFLNITIV